MHARAEGETLYRSLMAHSNHEVVREGLVGRDEHDIAFKLEGDLRLLNFQTEWTDDADAKMKVLAGLVHHHLKEEEKVMFPLARKSLLAGEFTVLASDYLELCEFYLDGDRRTSVAAFVSWPLNL
jgi:hemerythrin-like domain-containing protein